MLLELKWHKARQPASALFQFTGKVAGKLVGTIGLFVSISGYSPDAVDALVVGKSINIVLMDGDDIRAVVHGNVEFEDLLRRKLRAAAEAGTPFVPWNEATFAASAEPKGRQVVLTEGRLDERILRVVSARWGEWSDQQTFMPVAGPRNFAPVVETLVPMLASPAAFVVVAEAGGDGGAIRRRIEEDLAQRVPGADVHVVVLDPDLEVLVGLFRPGEFASGRRKVLDLSDELLRQRLEQALPSAAHKHASELSELAAVLRLHLPGPNVAHEPLTR